MQFIEKLDARQLLSAHPIFDPGVAGPVYDPPPSEYTVPLTSIPQLNSLPSASAKLYLDFDGAVAMSWGSYSVTETPAYDVDGDATTFSDVELSNIQQIWARVAEKYSPYNINVTTVDPGTYADKVATRVVIGGSGAWTGGSYGGVAYVGGFYNSSSNTCWVFENNLGNGNPKYTAEASAHEAGHTFGLQHQSQYDATGTKIAEYYQGNGATAPIMGNSYYATRGLWWYGTSVTATTYQDDMLVLSNTSNGFGYRTDVAGIIEKTTDTDKYVFTTAGATEVFTVNVAANGPMLDAKLYVVDAANAVWGTADTANFGETLNVTLPAGQYWLVVASHGSYGDVGQYTVSGTETLVYDDPVVPPPPVNVPPDAPTNLTVTASKNRQVKLYWTDNATTETGFYVQRSTDGVNWSTIKTLAANAVSYTDPKAGRGVFYYRVAAYNSYGTSAWSNVVSVSLGPVGLFSDVLITE